MRKKVLIAVGVVLVVAAAAFGFYAHQRASRYAEATRLAQEGDVQGAYELFDQLGGYSDSRAQRAKLVEAHPVLPYRHASKGDLVEFGSWEQDGLTENGAEPIRWVVLDKVGGCVLLLSESCLDGRQYNPAEFQSVTWEECDLRSWLNADFMQIAFTSSEQSLIPEVVNVNEDRLGASDEDDPMAKIFADGGTGTDQMGVGGADTRDRVFLLSETDTLIYLHDDLTRETIGKARLVEAAASRDVRVADDDCVGWWLRSPGVYSFTAQYVDDAGAPYPSGAYVELYYGVRPALWLDLEGDGLNMEGA